MASDTTSMDWGHVGEPAGAARAASSAGPHEEEAAAGTHQTFTDPAQYAELAAKTMHLKSVMKLPIFSGEPSEWKEWRFRADAIWTLLGLKEILGWAATASEVNVEENLLTA